MPLYDYKCTEHGLFHELVPVQASGEACPCPTCGVLSARVILVAPEVLDMAPERRSAFGPATNPGAATSTRKRSRAAATTNATNPRSSTPPKAIRCFRRRGPG
jgi:putative FmdB family regulatory protein